MYYKFHLSLSTTVGKGSPAKFFGAAKRSNKKDLLKFRYVAEKSIYLLLRYIS